MTQRASLAEQLPALFEQIGEDIRSLTTVITGNGRPDMPETTDGKITGNEPNGVVYYSLDGANVGAWQWTKRNGKWQCTYGDTGWVTLTNVRNLAGGANVKMRRINQLIMMFLGGLKYDLFGYLGTQEAGYKARSKRAIDIIPVKGIPLGFRSTTPFITDIYQDSNLAVIGSVYIAGTTDDIWVGLMFPNGLPKQGRKDVRIPLLVYMLQQMMNLGLLD